MEQNKYHWARCFILAFFMLTFGGFLPFLWVGTNFASLKSAKKLNQSKSVESNNRDHVRTDQD